MILQLVIMAVVLTAAPLAEFVSEGNSISYDCCTVVCDASYVYADDGVLFFDNDRMCVVSYDDSVGTTGDLTFRFDGNVPDGTVVTLKIRADGSESSLEGRFADGCCYLSVKGLRSGTDAEVSGSIGGSTDADLRMTVSATDRMGCTSFWMSGI